MRTGRASETSRERTTTISPRTPRRSGSASRAARPRQSTTRSPGAAPTATIRRRSGSTRRARARRSTRAASARRGSRCASSGKNSARRKRPARSGSSAAMRSRVDPFEAFGTLGEAREIGGVARLRHDQAAVADGAGKAFGPPVDRRRAERGDRGVGRGALAPRRQHAAGLPGAAPSPSARPRSTTSTCETALGKFQRAAEACDAGANDDDGGLAHSMNSRSFAGMTRIRFKGFSLTRLSQPGLLAETGHPSDVIERRGLQPLLSSRAAARPGPRDASTRRSLRESGSRTSFWKSAIRARATGPA